MRLPYRCCPFVPPDLRYRPCVAWLRLTRSLQLSFVIFLLGAGAARATEAIDTFAYQDQEIFAPSPSLTVRAQVSAPGWTVNSITINVDGTDYPATLQGTAGSITWDSSKATNPSEHYVTASANLTSGSTTETIHSTDTTSNGRAADFIIANLQIKDLQFNSGLTLRQDTNNLVPTPQLTWDQNNHSTTAYQAGYVKGSTPGFTIDLYPLTGSVTMGFTLTMSASIDANTAFFYTKLITLAPQPSNTAPASPRWLYHQFTNDSTIFDSLVRFGGVTSPADLALSTYQTDLVDSTKTPPGDWNPQPPSMPTIISS